MSLRRSLFPVVIACLAFSLSAGPKIRIDSSDFDIGVAKEETSSHVNHTYIVSNPGDSTLIISNVRPGCGCTSAGFDSTIPPGKTGRINVEVNTEHFSEGPFEKKISVISNADREAPAYTLTIRGIKRSTISTTPTSVHFNAGPGRDTGEVLLLKTDRQNLAVTGVSFTTDQNDAAMGWRTSIPMSYTLTRLPDSITVRDDASKTGATEPGLATYRLKIRYSPSQKGDLYGQLIIKTNIPVKPEISISGMIESARQ
jgi:hypothetical protein